jgi:hypothetical protein
VVKIEDVIPTILKSHCHLLDQERARIVIMLFGGLVVPVVDFEVFSSQLYRKDRIPFLITKIRIIEPLSQ